MTDIFLQNRSLSVKIREVIILTFTLPIIGTWTLAITNPIYSIAITFGFAFAAPLTIATIYYFGLVPSLMTGCMFVILRHRQNPGIVVIVTALTGSGASIIWLGWSHFSQMTPIGIFSDQNLMHFSAVSGLASMVVALPDYLHHLRFRNGTEPRT